MQVYETPGVYYERVDATRPGTFPIRTDIAGFVGIAERGPLHRPVLVESWRQFQSWFGGFIGSGLLGYAVRAFFENGGRRCWIVRVSADTAATASATILTIDPLASMKIPRWIIEASSPGVWGNDVDVELREISRAQSLNDPSLSRAEYSVVESPSGFERGSLVRLTQAGSGSVHYKVVSEVDTNNRRLWWKHPSQELRLPYDSLLDPVASGFAQDFPILIENIEYTLFIKELGRLKRVFNGLSPIPEHRRYGPSVLPVWRAVQGEDPDAKQWSSVPLLERVAIREANEKDIKKDPAVSRPAWVPRPLEIAGHETFLLQGGADGLAGLGVEDFAGEPTSPLDSHEVKIRKRRGLQAFYEVDEISILSVPDIHIRPVVVPQQAPPVCVPDPCMPSEATVVAPTRKKSVGDVPPVFSDEDVFRVQSAMILQCETLRDRIAVLDPPWSVSRNDQHGIGALLSWRRRFDSKYAALYYPWIKVADPLRSDASLLRNIPPSGHVIGQYANTDVQIGVHKAPANAPLIWIQDVTAAVNDVVHGVLNEGGVNVIRPFPSRGLRIFGARTISSDPDWRYVNVRRLLMMVEKAIAYSSQWAVFEPNNAFTRAKLHLSISSFLLELWQKGALQGKQPSEAFVVQCNEDNNLPNDRVSGRLLAEVKVAPSNPFEFVVLRVGLVNNELEIIEDREMVTRR